MGLFTDLAENTDHCKAASPREATRPIGSGLIREDKIRYEKGAGESDARYSATDGVWSIATHVATVSGGTYTLTVTLPTLGGRPGVTFTTAGIAWNATAATIEAAIDTASPATVPNGDVAVTEAGTAGLSDGACGFTFEDAVGSLSCEISINGASLTGGGTAGAVTQSQYTGQPLRRACQALYDLNLVAGTVHNCGDDPTWTKPACNGTAKPNCMVIKALARECTDEDGADYAYAEVLRLYPEIANVS